MSQFRFTVTIRSDEKDRWNVGGPVSPDTFIANLIKRGHTVGPKDGTGLIAGVFAAGSRLEQKNLEYATGLILDIDGKKKKTKDTPPDARLSEDGKYVLEVIPPDWLLGKLPFRGVAHSSYTNTPQQPKYRVIMPLAEPVSPTEFLRLWFWIFEMTERKPDPACKNPDRMFFLPRTSQEAKDQGWSWTRQMHGPLLSYSMVPADFRIPDEYAHELTRPKKKQGAHGAAASTRYRHTDATKLLECLLELPIYQWAIECAEDVSREVWRGLATNIAAVVMDDDNAIEAGSKAFHEISEADDNRYTWQATEKCFRDALKSAAHPGPMSYATLKLNGAPDDCDQDEAAGEGEGHAKAPVSHARKALYIKETSYRPKEPAPASKPPATGAASVEAPTASAALTTTAVSTPEALPPEDVDPLNVDPNQEPPLDEVEEMDAHDFSQDDFLYDMQRNGYVMRKPDKLTGVYEWNLDDLYVEAAIKNLLTGLGMDEKHFKGWRAQIKHFQYIDHNYTQPPGLIRSGTLQYFNTYRPTSLISSPGNWDPIRELFLHLVGGDVNALEYTLDWYASPLQKIRNRLDPSKDTYKMGTGLVLRGDPGAGKGLAMQILSLCYGIHNRVVLGQDDLDGKFHTNIANKLFVICNEVMSSSNRSPQTANKLKSWITDPEIPCEGKHADAKMIDNNFNIVFTSNDEKPVIIDKGDRRYSVFQSTAINKKLVQPIIDDLSGSQSMVAAFYDHLLSRQVVVKYGELYETNARTQVQAYSAPTSERFAAAIAEDGFMSVAAPWVESSKNGEIREPVTTFNGEAYILSEVLMGAYKTFCHGHGVYPQNIQAVTRALKEVFPTCDHTCRIRVGGVQRRAWRGLPVESPNADILPIKPLAPAETAKITANGDSVSFENDPQEP